MLHPSYSDLIEAVNSNVEPGEQPIVQSRYSIVIAASKRARELIAGDDALVGGAAGKKPLSVAVQELYEQKVKIVIDDPLEEAEAEEESENLREEEADVAEDKAKEEAMIAAARAATLAAQRESAESAAKTALEEEKAEAEAAPGAAESETTPEAAGAEKEPEAVPEAAAPETDD